MVSVNGEESEKTELSNEVISAPVNQVVVVGTARSLVTSGQRRVAYSQGFIFPLPKSKYVVSAYYGDGRNHKGIDLATDAGTAIYAVKDGTVIFSGWDGGYGYSIVIDHGNGIKTRYAHASRLLIAAGEKVYAGNTIALVGSTGQSTGNHLHFEVIVNGVNYDPAPYIGLG
ncbi:MAG: peptidoglycan DD-metalloendopeptidase family protein [Clostridia bacterium]|nr:peptidoglycan DD-metalloendopeptidase family protein [Clostridia bacterium]